MSFKRFTLALLLVIFCVSSLGFAKKIRGPKVTKCLARDRIGDLCPMIYEPVCGYKPNQMCITTVPCNYVTYSNACEACHDKEVASYTKGECPAPVPLE